MTELLIIESNLLIEACVDCIINFPFSVIDSSKGGGRNDFSPKELKGA